MPQFASLPNEALIDGKDDYIQANGTPRQPENNTSSTKGQYHDNLDRSPHRTNGVIGNTRSEDRLPLGKLPAEIRAVVYIRVMGEEICRIVWRIALLADAKDTIDGIRHANLPAHHSTFCNSCKRPDSPSCMSLCVSRTVRSEALMAGWKHTWMHFFALSPSSLAMNPIVIAKFGSCLTRVHLSFYIESYFDVFQIPMNSSEHFISESSNGHFAQGESGLMHLELRARHSHKRTSSPYIWAHFFDRHHCAVWSASDPKYMKMTFGPSQKLVIDRVKAFAWPCMRYEPKETLRGNCTAFYLEHAWHKQLKWEYRWSDYDVHLHDHCAKAVPYLHRPKYREVRVLFLF